MSSTKLDIMIGSFQIPGAASQVQRVSKDFKRLEGMVGERVQKIFDTLRWNTTYTIENLAGVFIKENDSYNGNIGLLERNKIDLYFTPNSINLLTRRIGITTPATSNQLVVMQIVDPPKAQASSDIMTINMAYTYWLYHGLAWCSMVLIMAYIFLRSYQFIFRFLNKPLGAKKYLDMLLTANFFVVTLFIEQLKSQDKSQSFIRFTISFFYLGIWLWNRLFGAFMQTEAFKIDTSEIISSYDRTQTTNYQACLIANEPLTYGFLEGRRRIFSSMFPRKPRHLYEAQLDDIMNFMRNHKTRVFVAPDVYVKSVGWSVCEYFKEEMGDRKVYVPMFWLDEDIASYYYSLKSTKEIINEIEFLSKAAIENQLIFYQRNPSKLNLLETDVQSTCVVRSLKLLEEASVHTGYLDHKIALDSFSRFFTIYFLFITAILLITLVIFLVHFIQIRLMSEDTNVFRKKLGKPLNEERMLEERDLSRSALDRLYVNVNSINELVDSKELELFLNPFHIDIIHEEYELMRVKYRAIRNRIEDKILQSDGHFQTNRRSITQLQFDLNDPRLPKVTSQRDVLLNSRFNQQIRRHLHQQTADSSPKRVRFRALHSDDTYRGFSRSIYDRPRQEQVITRSTYEQSGFSRFLRNLVGGGGVVDIPRNTSLNIRSSGQSVYWQRLRQRLEADRKNRQMYQFAGLKPFEYMFKYSLPNSLDLVMNKYNRKGTFD